MRMLSFRSLSSEKRCVRVSCPRCSASGIRVCSEGNTPPRQIRNKPGTRDYPGPDGIKLNVPTTRQQVSVSTGLDLYRPSHKVPVRLSIVLT